MVINLVKDILIIKDPRVAKLFADRTRREILHNLKFRELTAADLSRALDKSPSSIAHHLSLLKDVGLVEETRTEIKRNLVQTYYRSTAGNFNISYNLSDSYSPEAKEVADWSKEILKKGLMGLKAFGYQIPEEEVPSLLERLDLWIRLKRKAYEEVAEQQITPTGLETPSFKIVMDLLSDVRLAENPEFGRLTQDLADALALYSAANIPKREAVRRS